MIVILLILYYIPIKHVFKKTDIQIQMNITSDGF